MKKLLLGIIDSITKIIMKNIPFIFALTLIIGCTPGWEERGFASEEESLKAEAMGFYKNGSPYSDVLALGIPDADTLRAFYLSNFIDWSDQLNRDNADLFMAATKAGFHNNKADYIKAKKNNINTGREWIYAVENSKLAGFSNIDNFFKAKQLGIETQEDYVKAKKNNIDTKEEWLNVIEGSKLGGFYSIDNYFKAKELGIKTQTELTQFVTQLEYNEMLLSGMRTAGAYYAVNEMCQDISRYLIATTNNNSDQRLFMSLGELFDRKKSLDWSEINETPLNDEELRAFENAKNNEFGNFYNQLSSNASNQKWLMDYLTKNCSPRMIQICDVSRAKNDRSVVKTCNDLSAYGL